MFRQQRGFDIEKMMADLIEIVTDLGGRGYSMARVAEVMVLHMY
jgi:hypothetical protein